MNRWRSSEFRIGSSAGFVFPYTTTLFSVTVTAAPFRSVNRVTAGSQAEFSVVKKKFINSTSETFFK
jgi:hypothetical protein